MNKNWKYGILDDAVDKGSSNISLNKIKEEVGDYPVFGAKGFMKNVSFYQQEKEYLGIIKDGAGIGRVSKHPAKSSILATMQYIIPKEDYEIDFVRYFLESLDFENYRTGSTIPHIYYKDYKTAKFPLVDISEQKQIVALLDKAFAAIDQAKANIEKNRENAKELFQSKLNAIFSHPSTSSGQDGEGWEEKTLGEVISITHGYAFKSKNFETDFEGENPIVLTPGNFAENSTLYFTYKNTKRLTGTYKKEYLFYVGDLVIVMTDLSSKMKILGKPAIIDSQNILHNQRIGRVIFKTKNIDTEFIYYYFQTSNYLKKIKESSTGTMVKHTAPSRILKNQITYPELLDDQKLIVKSINDLKYKTYEIESQYQQKLTNLEDLKKSILQKAFSGELTSPEGT